MAKKLILILGGNGFIGAEVVDYLSNENKDYEFILLNRGNWSDWDTESRIKSKIRASIVFDRRTDSIQECLTAYLIDTQLNFEALLDFSAYKGKDIRRVVTELPADKVKLYVYISSDSVYEVCVDKQHELNEEIVLNESDSLRPDSKTRRNYLKDFDSYGHHKLKCEEVLADKSYNQIPYICLRLPDVIGPRDSVDRFWFYQMWLQYLAYAYPPQTEHEICIPKFYFSRKTSYVYVRDVARFIDLILKSDVKNEIFNLGLYFKTFFYYKAVSRHTKHAFFPIKLPKYEVKVREMPNFHVSHIIFNFSELKCNFLVIYVL